MARPLGTKRIFSSADRNIELSADGKTYNLDNGVQIDSSMNTVNNKKARFTSIDPQGRAGVVPDPDKPYGPKYVDGLVNKIIESNTPLSNFLRVVGGITHMKDMTGSSGPGGVDSIVSSIVQYEKALEEAHKSDTSGLSNEARARNSVIMGNSDGSHVPLSTKEKEFVFGLAGAVPNNNTPIPSLKGVPPRLTQNLIANMPSLSFASRDDMIREGILNGTLDRNYLDAAEALFPKTEGKALSLKFAFDTVLSGFFMINAIIKAQADNAVLWLTEELVDPELGTSKFINVDFLSPVVLAYAFPEKFGMLVAYLVQTNNPMNGMPVSESTKATIAQNLQQAMVTMLKTLSRNQITFQGTRGYTKNKRDDKRPWIGK